MVLFVWFIVEISFVKKRTVLITSTTILLILHFTALKIDELQVRNSHACWLSSWNLHCFKLATCWLVSRNLLACCNVTDSQLNSTALQFSNTPSKYTNPSKIGLFEERFFSGQVTLTNSSSYSKKNYII